LPILCEKIRKIGFKVKVDTNGTNPAMIKRLIEKQLVDYIAMDVKAPLAKEKYSEACGVNANPFLEKIRGTIETLMNGTVEYEFRTTVVPTLHQAEDIEKICQVIKGCKKYALQNFKSDVETLHPKYQSLKQMPKTQMEKFLQIAKAIAPNATLRS